MHLSQKKQHFRGVLELSLAFHCGRAQTTKQRRPSQIAPIL